MDENPITHPISESPSSQSHYGEFYWDTNADADLDIDIDGIISGLNTGANSANIFGGPNGNPRLGQTQEDLHKYKQRIDANVEQQREYSEIIAAMQTKVRVVNRRSKKFRRKNIC